MKRCQFEKDEEYVGGWSSCLVCRVNDGSDCETRDCIRHPMVRRWISGLSGRPTGDCACGAEEGDLCRRKIAFWHYPRYSDFETFDDAGACTDMIGYYAARDGWWVRMLMLAAGLAAGATLLWPVAKAWAG